MNVFSVASSSVGVGLPGSSDAQSPSIESVSSSSSSSGSSQDSFIKVNPQTIYHEVLHQTYYPASSANAISNGSGFTVISNTAGASSGSKDEAMSILSLTNTDIGIGCLLPTHNGHNGLPHPSNMQSIQYYLSCCGFDTPSVV